jgi:UDP-glucose 4-epimerase
MLVKTRKSVVTGGAGFIGHHLVNALAERGDTVIAIDNLAGGAEFFRSRRNLSANVSYDHTDIADVSNAKHLEDLCKGADHVYHLAALPRVQASIDDPVGTLRVNVVGTVAMLNAARKAGVKRFIFASSSSVYGESEELPLVESQSPEPMSPYARHKYHGEQYCHDFALFFNLPTVCLRFFNVYGPGADPNGAYALVVAKFLEQKRRGEALTITGNGDQTRDFTHVSDVVQAILLAAESAEVGMGETINIGGGKQISVNEVADLIGGPTVYIEPRLEPHDTLASIAKAERLLKWKPLVSFKEGIKQLLKLNHL